MTFCSQAACSPTDYTWRTWPGPPSLLQDASSSRPSVGQGVMKLKFSWSGFLLVCLEWSISCWEMIDRWTNGLDLFSFCRFNVSNTILHPEIVEWWVWLVAVCWAQPRKVRDPAVPAHSISESPSDKLVPRTLLSASSVLYFFVRQLVCFSKRAHVTRMSIKCLFFFRSF